MRISDDIIVDYICKYSGSKSYNKIKKIKNVNIQRYIVLIPLRSPASILFFLLSVNSFCLSFRCALGNVYLSINITHIYVYVYILYNIILNYIYQPNEQKYTSYLPFPPPISPLYVSASKHSLSKIYHQQYSAVQQLMLFIFDTC